ncbi:hypothetical protein [Nakamurella endophytica]|uniref:hypothetical protein n=1 Tax=Nakamurella endophytica TaxID=1748367 RepID=UPI001669398B|nr:hypothetical protein [Nakamurella endophytica]
MIDHRPGTADVRVTGAVALVLGMALVVVASFLPWAVSGAVARNSYEVGGLAGRLGLGGAGAARTVLEVWPFLGPACVLPVLLVALGRWGTAAAVAAVLGVATAALAATTLVVLGGRQVVGVRLDPTGPAVLLVGAVLAVAGAALVALLRPHRPAIGGNRTRPLFVAPAPDDSGVPSAVPTQRGTPHR